MPLLPAALLLACLAALVWVTWRDLADHAAFKRLTDTAERQRRYRLWLGKSLGLFLALPLACLALLGRLGDLTGAPAEFQPLGRQVQALVPLDRLGPVFLGGMVGGAVVAGVFALVLTIGSLRKAAAQPPRTLGDIAAILPRNGAETLWTALLALNAGVSEEVFFRLTLPLLVVLAGGGAALAFIGAGVIFGLAHIYQGWLGVAATTLIGFVFTGLYLASGGLAVPIAIHVAIDIVGLVIRPTLSRLAAGRLPQA